MLINIAPRIRINKSRSATGAWNQRLRRLLLTWFDQNKRDLPWRRGRDPYRVWISEIMLQQTRVAAVIEHYGKFLRRFPTVDHLAAARERSVLAMWSGLGYYRRARMLHAAAKEIVRELGGKFPETATDWRNLPGIGPYTSAAIASIAFNEPVAVVDGNVERVVQRIRGQNFSDAQLWRLAEDWLSPSRPGDFNQAMMELGAVICQPRAPKCLRCPLAELCITKGELKKRRARTRQHKRTIYYAFDQRDGSIFLVQRPGSSSLMPGMWELPEIADPNGWEHWLRLRHSITVTDYSVHVLRRAIPPGVNGSWVQTSRIPRLPLTGLTRKILRAAEII